MQAIILAAGMGKRLKELTQNNTKCMVKVNGVTLCERLLNQIDRHNLNKIVIVVGYEGQKLIDYISTLDIKTPIEFIDNPIYDKTNNIYSLALAKKNLCEDDTLLFESDLIFEDSILEALINDPRETLALVDKYEPWMDGTCVRLNNDDGIVDFVPGKKFDYSKTDEYYKTVNIYKFSKDFSNTRYVPFLEAYQNALGVNEYYEQVLRVISMLDEPGIKGMRLSGQKWYEIDDAQDLDIAESLFSPDEDKKLEMLQSRYGGYWRYPKMIDFCYLVNPYYPPKKMVDELKNSFETLLTQYPSGMKVNALLAAKNFGVRTENIVVGNGAAELIKSLMGMLKGKVGVMRPTFEEYPHRYDEQEIVEFWSDKEDFSYDENDLIEFFGKNKVDNIVLINPDNPSGNYINKAGLIKLIDWTKNNGIKLVIDESFADFSDELDNTMFDTELLINNKHLYVMKSISKSYGVPGLRLGVLASGDVDTISAMKKDVAIWNINSFGEYYLQIAEKYSKDYVAALAKFRTERARFVTELSKINGLRVFKSQANYLMIELSNGIQAKDLCKKLISNYEIIIKDLSSKIKREDKQYIRVAVKTTEENTKLINAIKDLVTSA